ncbi:hypothetical protein MKW94_021012 [Papaver nudicaule]|uniref:Cupin type-1 domain-containing protein n=1 Tax=Papaver nudicaule TaxID=74823 RepID=A0AA41VPH0_PAPNU|nr:hypothetical protein [Papaver nudicaule]
MDVDLTPKVSKSVYGGDGGSYFSWSPSDLPMLKEGNIGASKIALQKNGLAMPSYSDSAKVAYILQGKGIVGIYLYEAEMEKVVSIKEGDAMALPFAGEFTEFALTGANGLFTGFTTEFVKELVGSQKGIGIIKVKDGFKMLEPKEEDLKGMVMNCLEAPLDIDIKNGGRVVLLNSKSLPLVKDVGLGADLVRIDAGSMCSPGFSCDSAYQVTYIVRGSGRAQIVVKAGNLFIVPSFFTVSKIADGEGMEWFSIITPPNPEVLQASFNVSPEAEQHFRSKRLNAEIFFSAP